MSHRRLGDAVDQWLAHVPPELASVSRIDAIRGGTLHVVVASPSHLWSLDRLLRGGLTDTLVCAIGPPIQRIRLRIGPLDPTPDPNAAERDARRIPPAR